MSQSRYAVVTPVRNEADHLSLTIRSMAWQTFKPWRWVLVNDGSADETGQLIDAAAKEHPWIQAVHRPDRGFRQAGGGVVESFYDGYRRVATEPWDFVVKLDGDLSFKPDYFERCLARFDADPKLGIGGGTICSGELERPQPECPNDVPFHVRGATKIYKRPCWEAIGGLIRAPGWDTLDELKANMLGWRTVTFAELPLIHHRRTGEADGSWKNWVKNGRANYIVGYHPLFMLSKCVSRCFERPFGLAAAALMTGYLGGYLKRLPQIEDKALIRYLRRQQVNRLLFRPSLWDK